MVTRGIYVSALLLLSMPPDLVLRTAFYPLEGRGTDKRNVTLHPIVWNLAPRFGHITLPTMCERSKLWRALLPKGSATSLQKAFTAGARWSLYLSS